jgi:hypothetical protein
MQVSVRAAHLQDGPAVEEVLASSYPRLMSGSYDEDLLRQVLPLMTCANPKLLGS